MGDPRCDTLPNSTSGIHSPKTTICTKLRHSTLEVFKIDFLLDSWHPRLNNLHPRHVPAPHRPTSAAVSAALGTLCDAPNMTWKHHMHGGLWNLPWNLPWNSTGTICDRWCRSQPCITGSQVGGGFQIFKAVTNNNIFYFWYSNQRPNHIVLDKYYR